MSDTTITPNPAPERPYFERTSGGFTPGQMESAASALAKHWTGDPAVLKARLAEMGLEPVAAEPVPVDPETAAIEHTFGGAEARDYDLGGLFLGRDLTGIEGVNPMEGQIALDVTLRQAMQDMELPRVLGHGFAESVLDAAQAWSAMTPEQAAVHSAHQISMAVQATHAPSREAMMNAIKPVLAKLDPDTATTLAEAGVFENASVLANLYLHGQRMASR